MVLNRFAKFSGRQCIVDRLFFGNVVSRFGNSSNNHDDINRFLRKEVQMSSHIGGRLPFLNSYSSIGVTRVR